MLGLLLAVGGSTAVNAAHPEFPGANPDESVRVHTPDDPEFDRCEPDDEDGTQECSNVFGQEWQRFGFAPNGSQITATYKNDGCARAISSLTLPLCGDAHTRRLIEQNLKAGRVGPGQVSGVSVDRAWKRSLGDPSVQIAILDTGIRWNRRELRTQIALNRGELPLPQQTGGSACSTYDCNGDGAFNVDDYADDPRVAPEAGHDEADGMLDASDLIATFSSGSHGDIAGGADDDGNGYADDIAGWDFFDDDNDPYDASSYSSAGNHGSARAEEAAAETNNAAGGTGLCPSCQIVPIRVWDTFVVDTNFFAQGVAYAADNGVEVVEGAIGGLTNSRFSREAFERAYEQGVFFAIVSSDLNTSSHNTPTTYDEAMMVNGTVADVNGLGIEIPGVSDTLLPGLNRLLGGLAELPVVGRLLGLVGGAVPLGTNIPIGTWFRNSGTTQYGEHMHVAMPGTTGSEATGQASGAAGLVASYGRKRIAAYSLPGPEALEPNEIKQILTLTAEDVLPVNTDVAAGVTGLVAAVPPDPAQKGWDRHFGYGRPDLGLALERIARGEIPPQAMITSPDWFAPFNVERQDAVAIHGAMAAKRVPGGNYDWRLEWAPGAEPAEAEFTPERVIAESDGTGEVKGLLGTVNLEAVRAALDERQSVCPTIALPPATGGDILAEGGAPCDPTMPGMGAGDVNPNEPAFTVRLVVTDSAGNRGEDRKVMYAYREPDEHPGWSRPIGGEQDATGAADSGGEASQRMYDLDGDNELEVVEATSSGELHVFGADGTPSPAFNGGEPVRTQPYGNVEADAPFYDSVDPPREALRTPAIGDIDGDREPEIVDTAGEHIYAWEADGDPVAGFPQRIEPAFSLPAERSRINHVKPGFIGSPALADVDGDGALEIFAAALDQHLYGWRGDGSDVPGFPVYLRERDANGEPLPCSAEVECAESINTPAIGDIDGDETPEIVIATNEFADTPGVPPLPGAGDLTGLLGALVSNLTAGLLGGEGRVYAVSSEGEILPGWPVKPGGTLPDALPFIGPGHDFVLGNADGDPESEAIGAITTGELQAWDADGSSAATYPSLPVLSETPLAVKAMSFFEYPILADFAGTSRPEVAKAGVSITGLLNLGVLTGLNLPYNHLLQAWSHTVGGNPVAVPGYPQAIEDYQLLSSPAAADVAGGDGVEILAGTGLYHIRSFDSLGQEAEGWPKFTGGWNFAVPAAGDADADGKLEVAVMTREGFSFMWDTERPACTEDGGDNEQWWTSRHDEWNTGDYATDSRPPGAPEDLTAVRRPDGGVDLSWTAPGDDWLCGTAASFQVLAAKDPIVRPGGGTVAKEVAEGIAGGGQTEKASLSAAEVGEADELAILYRDDAGNWGRLAGVSLQTGTQPPSPPRGPCSNRIQGDRENNKLAGTRGSDRIKGRAGDDRLRGRGGRDCVNGGRGEDRVNGGGGADTLHGGRGRDLVRGGPGNDRIRIRKGRADIVRCGPGRDRVWVGRGDRVRGCERVIRP